MTETRPPHQIRSGQYAGMVHPSTANGTVNRLLTIRAEIGPPVYRVSELLAAAW